MEKLFQYIIHSDQTSFYLTMMCCILVIFIIGRAMGENRYTKYLVMKADNTHGRTAVHINGKFFYIVPESEYVKTNSVGVSKKHTITNDCQVFDVCKPYQTRDGRAARITSITYGDTSYPICAKVEHPNEPGRWVEWNYMADGRWKSNDNNNPNDLVNIH